VYQLAHVMLFEPISWSPTCVNWAIVEMNYKSFLMRRPSSRKDRLFEWSNHICPKLCAVHFDIIWKSVNNMEAARIPYDCKHAFFALYIKSPFCGHIISWQSPHPTRWYIDEKPGLITRHKMMPAITLGSIQERQYRSCMLFPFWRKSSANRRSTQRKWNDLKPIDTWKMLEYCCVTSMQSFSSWTSRFERRFIQYRPNFGIKIIERRSSTATFVMDISTRESYLSNPESNRSKFVDMFMKLCLKSGCDLVDVDSLML
jgi:hypothetical protein